MTKRILLLPLLALLGSCVSRDAPAPPPSRPQARPAPTPGQVPPPAPTPAPVGWADLPLTPGTWSYAGYPAGEVAAAVNPASAASYGPQGAPLFTIACDGPGRAVVLTRRGAATLGTMAIRTSFGARALPTVMGPQSASATLSPRDPFLDGMIFSRGRFSVEAAGTPMLMMPSWAEPARVVEDCRRADATNG